MYIDNNELRNELLKCQKNGMVSDKLARMFILISTNISKKYIYGDIRDSADCISFSILEVLLYWHKYDPNRGYNAFAFISQIAWNGLYKGFKKLQCTKSVKLIAMSDIINLFD